MSRRIVACHEPGGELNLAYSGPPPPVAGEVICLLDGHLDNGAEISARLGLGREEPAERLLALAYRRWGRHLPALLRGDFLVAIWDREAGTGLIARDQLGVRPAYLHRAGGVLRLATDLPSLLAQLPHRPEPDPASVAHWIAASSRPGTQTLYRGVERLAAGTMLVLDRGGARRLRYWEPRFEQPLAEPPAELAARVRAALETAVRRRLTADAPTAVLLSGGLDSAAVAALAVEAGEGEVRACSGAFPEHPAADESALIAALRTHLGLRGPIADVGTGGLLESAAEHVAAAGAPPLGWGDFWTLPLLREAAAEGASVVLGGDGGDELFGPRQIAIADALRAGRPRRALALAGRLPGAGPQVPRRRVAALLAGEAVNALPLAAHDPLERHRLERRAPSWLLPGSRRALLESSDPLAWKRLDGPLWWSELAHGVGTRLDEVGVFEHQRRRAAMAGIEARHPLLDLDLVELCLRLPPEASLDPRYNRPLLRAGVAGLVPDEIRLRPRKARFESLVAGCLTGPEMSALRALLLDPAAELRAYVDQDDLRRQLLEGRGDLKVGGFRWMWFVWRLATAESWLRRYDLFQLENSSTRPEDHGVPEIERASIGKGVSE